MYRAQEDPYCYPGGTVLKNKPGLTDQLRLDVFETALTAQRFTEPLPFGRLSVTHYRAIHRHIFQDVYGWAGRYRTVRIHRGSSTFCYPENISAQMLALFDALRRDRFLVGLASLDFARRSAHFLAELNAIHPFRDGNGRTQMAFLTLLSHVAGHPLDIGRLDPLKFRQAVVASFGGSEQDLRDQIESLIG